MKFSNFKPTEKQCERMANIIQLRRYRTSIPFPSFIIAYTLDRNQTYLKEDFWDILILWCALSGAYVNLYVDGFRFYDRNKLLWGSDLSINELLRMIDRRSPLEDYNVY